MNQDTIGGGEADFSAINAVADGDPLLARHLRASMAVIARRTEDPQLRQLIVSVLEGKQSVRRVFEHPSFQEMSSAAAGNLERGLDRLSDEERDALMKEVGEAHTPEETQFALMEGGPVPDPREAEHGRPDKTQRPDERR